MKKYIIILLTIIRSLHCGEQQLFEPTFTGLPPEIREKIISHLPDEEQIFAKLTLQQVNKQLRDEVNKLKNGTLEQFDAFLNKISKQLGPVTLENLISHLSNLQFGKSFQTNQNITLQINQIWNTLDFLKKAEFKQIEIPQFLLASLFDQWPIARRWLQSKHLALRNMFFMRTLQDQLTTYTIQLYFFASILSNGAIITKNQLIPLPASAIRKATSHYVFLTSAIDFKSPRINSRISLLFTNLLEIIYKINNIPAQEGIANPLIFLYLNDVIKNKQEPEKIIYKNLKDQITKMLFADLFNTSEKFNAEISETSHYKSNYFLRANLEPIRKLNFSENDDLASKLK